MMTMRILSVAFAGALLIASVASPAPQSSSETPELDGFLAKELLARPADLTRIHQGRPYVTPLASSVNREIVVAGVVRIDAPAARTVAAIRDIERFESGAGFIQTKRLSDPPKLDDFAAYRVDAEDLESLRHCRQGDCDVKLGRGAFPLPCCA